MKPLPAKVCPHNVKQQNSPLQISYATDHRRVLPRIRQTKKKDLLSCWLPQNAKYKFSATTLYSSFNCLLSPSPPLIQIQTLTAVLAPLRLPLLPVSVSPISAIPSFCRLSYSPLSYPRISNLDPPKSTYYFLCAADYYICRSLQTPSCLRVLFQRSRSRRWRRITPPQTVMSPWARKFATCPTLSTHIPVEEI